MAGAPRGPKATTRRGTLRRTAPGWRPGRWPLIGGAVVGLAVAGAGVSNWLAWVNEPLAQQRSAFSLAFAPAVQVPAVGAQSGQATATAVAPPPTVSAAARAVAANATPTPPAASTAGATAGNTVAASNAATATVTARSAATPAARSTAQATAAADSALGNRRRIVNTDGAGVALRSGPDGDRLRGKGYDEGVSVTILERSGPWTHIRGDDGRDGWIPTVTLTP
jgi:cytoskeletal protein RodZ